MEKAPLSNAERNRLIKLLNDVGLDDSEAAVYMAALGVGSRPASVIAQKAKLKRGQTYNVLNSLTEKGIVQQVEKNGVKHFSCSSPKALVGMLEARERELADRRLQLEQAIPELERLINPNVAQPRVRFYQGVEGLLNSLSELLAGEGDKIFSIADPRTRWNMRDPGNIEMISSFISSRESTGKQWYGICVPSIELDDHLRRFPSSTRFLKRFADKDKLTSEIFVMNSKVIFTSMEGEIFGILIEHEGVASTVAEMIGKLWDALPEY